MPSTPLRQDVLRAARRVVVKLGALLLTGTGGARASGGGASGGGPSRGGGAAIDTDFVADIAAQIAALRQRGYEVTLVSSGAVSAGCVELGLQRRPNDVAEQQALAAVGQRCLMIYWAEALGAHGLGVGQVLLTRSDFDDRQRFLNIRNCVARLHEMKCVPVLNENDTVAVEEIRFGDNDMLAALMCNALRADALLLLTAVEGFLGHDGQVVDRVDNVIDMLGAVRQREKSRWGTGGMQSKLEAARLVTEAGELAVIASGRQPDVIRRILDGQRLGSVFVPAARKLDSRQRWIGLTARPAGTLTVDDGAAAALVHKSKSLLATGLVEMTGRFQRGDVLLVRNPRGREIARGLTNYSIDELQLIRGKRSNQFAAILGRPTYKAVIHRDNLVTLSPAAG